MGKKIKGNITNPIKVDGKVITENEVRTDFSPSIEMVYQANSLSPVLYAQDNTYFMDNFSNIKNLIFKSTPTQLGNTFFNTVIPNNVCLEEFKVNESGVLKDVGTFDDIPMQYIDGGKTYTQFGSVSESNNFGWEPLSNEDKYVHVERSDVYGFDYPQFTPRGMRKIPPTTATTLCGPFTYYQNTYTYDRLNYNWLFGLNAGISFNPIQSGGTPVSISGESQSQEGSSSISNQEGKLLFYTNGEDVFTSGNTIMVNGSGLSSSGTSTQSSIIVPQPEVENKYFIFTTDAEGNPNGFEYSIVNMELQGGDGQVEAKNIKLINGAITEKVTSCNHSNGEDYWVITHTSGDSRYFSYLINSIGVQPPIISTTGVTHNTARGYMKTSPNGERLVSLIYEENIIEIFDFDNSGGTLSNSLMISGDTFVNGPYGLEFSSDSSKIYVSDGASTTIYQYDISYSSSTEISENRIDITNGRVPLGSLGALQMGPDEKIYVADNEKPYLHVIYRPDGLGVQCNFQAEDFYLTGASPTIISTWGLPNVVTTKSLSCDRYIYITPRTRENFIFDLKMNDVSDVIEPNKLNFTAEIYPYQPTAGSFSNNSVFSESYTYNRFSGDSGTTLTIPVSGGTGIGQGEFIIKGYYDYPIKTLISKQLGYRRNTINNYKRGTQYGIYNAETDWYFLNMFEADKPNFNNNKTDVNGGADNLTVRSYFTNAGETIFYYSSQSDPLVAYNGAVLAKDIEYSATTSSAGTENFITLLFDPLADQVVTLAYVEDGNDNDLRADTYVVTEPIESGTTNNQIVGTKLYYNTTHSTYEYFLEIQPLGNVIFTINGSQLINGVEYYESTSDPKRIIITDTIQGGDLLQAFYVPLTGVFGPLQTNQPNLSWSISNAPVAGESGMFTVQITTESDTDYENILYFGTLDYVIGQKSYTIVMNLSNSVAGDKLIYRIKNEKFYTPIVGEIITSIKYSDSIPVEIVTNLGNNY